MLSFLMGMIDSFCCLLMSMNGMEYVMFLVQNFEWIFNLFLACKVENMPGSMEWYIHFENFLCAISMFSEENTMCMFQFHA
jgi:hypothetical protein